MRDKIINQSFLHVEECGPVNCWDPSCDNMLECCEKISGSIRFLDEGGLYEF